MLKRRRLFALTGSAITAITLSACGNLPQPFRRVSNTSNPLLANPSGAGVGITPPLGIAANSATRIAARIADHLQQREIPAEAVARTGVLGFTLEGNLWETSHQGPATTLTLNWRLLNRRGQIVERLDQAILVDSAGWAGGADSELDRVAQDIAARLALLLAPPVETVREEPPQPSWRGTTVTIRKPASAPGDGAEALGRAMANRLAQQGFEPARDTPDVIVAATVSVEPYDAIQDDVAIIWQVLSPDGQDLGEVRLDNRVPRGELDGAWGMIAQAVVDGALPGLLEIIAATVEPKRP